jgi:hypothetical protein
MRCLSYGVNVGIQVDRYRIVENCGDFARLQWLGLNSGVDAWFFGWTSCKWCMYEGWSKISGTEFVVGKRKHLQVTRSYLLQSTTLQIACSDSSDLSTFQCMSGRIVWEWAATAVSYLVVSPRHLEIVSPSGCSSAWGRGRSRRGPNLVSKAGGEPREFCAWPGIPQHSGPRGMGYCGAEARYRKTICEAVPDELHLEGVGERLCRVWFMVWR